MRHKVAEEKAASHAPAPVKRSGIEQDYIVQNRYRNEDQSQDQDQSDQREQDGALFLNVRKNGMPPALGCKAQNCPTHHSNEE